MDTPVRVTPQAHYRRHLEGADFSLEANTEATPEAGHFYLLRSGQVLLRSDDFNTSELAYQQLCHEHWESQLESNDAAVLEGIRGVPIAW